MTEQKPAEDGYEERVIERSTERVISRECEHCGRRFEPLKTGRPPRYCSDSCRQQAYALRRAEARLGTPGDARPKVVQEVVERVTERTVERRPRIGYAIPASQAPVAAPRNARGWTDQLGVLLDQLADENSPVHREHWQHRRLYGELVRVVSALGRAHPGGLDRLQ